MPSSLHEMTGFRSSIVPTMPATRPMRPPLTRYSSVDTQKKSLVLSAALSTSRHTSANGSPCSISSPARIAEKPAPMPMFFVST